MKLFLFYYHKEKNNNNPSHGFGNNFQSRIFFYFFLILKRELQFGAFMGYTRGSVRCPPTIHSLLETQILNALRAIFYFFQDEKNDLNHVFKVVSTLSRIE